MEMNITAYFTDNPVTPPLECWLVVVCLIMTLICNSVYRSRISAMILNFFTTFCITLLAVQCFKTQTGPQRTSILSRALTKDLLLYKSYLIDYIFVPPIIFACAFSLDSHDFDKFRSQIFILIVPCFIVTTLLFGCMLFLYWYYVLPEEIHNILSMQRVFKMAAYLTAIDPITVSIMLDDLGLSHQLTSLLKFESLLCQASMKIFVDIINVINDPEWYEALLMDLAGLVICVVMGYIYGRALISVLSNILFVDHVAEGGMVAVMVYASYATGILSGSSGILCLVIFAITFNSGRNSIGQRTYNDTKTFWNTVSYGAHGILTSLVAITSGFSVAIGGKIQEKTVDTSAVIFPLAALFPMTIVARLISLMLFITALRFTGGFELEHLAMSVAAGVRGFLPITLVLNHMNEFMKNQRTNFSADYHSEALYYFVCSSAVFIVVILSQTMQTLCLQPIAKFLDLQLESRLHPEFMRSLATRVNAYMRGRLNERKSEKNDNGVNWELIEKEIVFDFTSETAKETKPVMKKPEETSSGRMVELIEEMEARERVQRCYEAQVRKTWQSYGRTSSVAMRVLENAINDAAVNRRSLNIERLFNNLQPWWVWRKVADFGRKCVKKLRAKRFIDQLAIYESFWRWRMFVCILSTSAAVFLVYTSTAEETYKNLTSEHFFYGAVISLLITIEQMIRLFRLIKKFLKTSPCSKIVTQPWFWFETILLLCEGAGDIVHFAIMLGPCIERELLAVDLSEQDYCRRARIAMTIADVLPVLQFPLIIGLLARLVLSEIEAYVLHRDEETFEAVNCLLIVTDTVIRLLAGRSLVQNPRLKKKLSDECFGIKSALEDKLIDLLSRQGGTATLANIKTRQASREVIEEVAALLIEAKQCGSLREFEYLCMDDVVNEMRAHSSQAIHEDKQLDEDVLYAKTGSSTEAGMEILTSQLRQMEWVRAVGSQEEMNDLISSLKASGRLEKFEKKQHITTEGNIAREWGVYILLNGFCRGINLESDKEVIRRRLIYAGTMFGENGLLHEQYTESVVAASPKVMTFWISLAVIEKLPPSVHGAFYKHVVSKACMDYLRQEERHHSWSDEMLQQFVRRYLKTAKAKEQVPEESLLLFRGTLIDKKGKRFTPRSPYYPMKLGPQSAHPFVEPLTVSKNEVVHYLVSRHDSGGSGASETADSDPFGDSFIWADLDSDADSIRSNKSKKSTSPYSKFKPLYTKMKKKKSE